VFYISSASLTWHTRGHLACAPTILQFRALRPGDHVENGNLCITQPQRWYNSLAIEGVCCWFWLEDFAARARYHCRDDQPIMPL